MVLLLCVLQASVMHAGESGAARGFEEVYKRAEMKFESAVFFKPVETNTEALKFKLAPLIMQEGVGTGEANAKPGFGAVTVSNGAPVLDLAQPALYVSADSVHVNGKAHARFTYVWVYDLAGEKRMGLAGTLALPGRFALPVAMQGVRMTLDKDGQPGIWEVLADGSGARVVFVSASVEAAALAEFGQPLARRRYAVERGVEEAPNVVVARVIDDGPMPMGPIVHVRASDYSVSTLICRCMAVQVKKLSGTETYALASWDETALAMSRRGAVFWPGEKSDELEALLRVPRVF